jgi:hypothetical protein
MANRQFVMKLVLRSLDEREAHVPTSGMEFLQSALGLPARRIAEAPDDFAS